MDERFRKVQLKAGRSVVKVRCCGFLQNYEFGGRAVCKGCSEPAELVGCRRLMSWSADSVLKSRTAFQRAPPGGSCRDLLLLSLVVAARYHRSCAARRRADSNNVQLRATLIPSFFTRLPVCLVSGFPTAQGALPDFFGRAFQSWRSRRICSRLR